eukprot:2544713-Pleurochrysis_carterae.AAC.2
MLGTRIAQKLNEGWTLGDQKLMRRKNGRSRTHPSHTSHPRGQIRPVSYMCSAEPNGWSELPMRLFVESGHSSHLSIASQDTTIRNDGGVAPACAVARRQRHGHDGHDRAAHAGPARTWLAAKQFE